MDEVQSKFLETPLGKMIKNLPFLNALGRGDEKEAKRLLDEMLNKK